MLTFPVIHDTIEEWYDKLHQAKRESNSFFIVKQKKRERGKKNMRTQERRKNLGRRTEVEKDCMWLLWGRKEKRKIWK